MKFVLIAALVLACAFAHCPGNCNGHGTCGANDICDCWTNWQSSDCSDRTCPFGKAWADTPSATEVAHNYAECSNAGVCDRKSGLCKCFDGFEGSACRRLACPVGCSGHGTCQTLKELAQDESYRVGGNAWNTYETSWDAAGITACKCDAGWYGASCSDRFCPRGSDPLVGGTGSTQVITNTVGASGANTGTYVIEFTDKYGGVFLTRPITFNQAAAAQGILDTAAEIKFALESLPNQAIDQVTVTGANAGPGLTNTFTVTFSGEAVAGEQNKMRVYFGGCSGQGCQPVYAGVSGTGASTQPVSVGASAGGQSAVAECSGRGKCDITTGSCGCYEGFTGDACQTQTILF